MGRGPIPMRRPKLPFHLAITARSTFGISPSFLGLSQSSGQVTHVLLTRSRLCPRPKPGSSLHLHVLGTPPAFVLSQDQTLREELLTTFTESRQEFRPAVKLTVGQPLGLSLVEQTLASLEGAHVHHELRDARRGRSWLPPRDGPER